MVTRLQQRWFRLVRSGLVKPLASPEVAARSLIGIQAQLPAAASVSLQRRVPDVSLEQLEQARVSGRSLVRMWGQRNTVHLYHADDWPLLVAAFADRRSLMEKRFQKNGLSRTFRSLVNRTAKRLASGEILTYDDIQSKKLEEGQEKWVVHYIVFMQLVREGLACHGPDQEGGRSGFVHRERWLPDLPWDGPPPEAARTELARRYFAAHGPAQLADLAFWAGISAAKARGWIAELADELTAVEVDGEEHLLLTRDLEKLQQRPPARSAWPVRLLGRFDPLLLATKDKTWLIDTEHYKSVWRPSAHVAPVLLVHGRIAGTWRYERKARHLLVEMQPFAPPRPALRRAIEREALEIAGLFGFQEAEVQFR